MKYIYLLIFSFFIISCNNKKQDKNNDKKVKPLMSVLYSHKKTEPVQKIFLKEVAYWDKLKIVDSFFVKFRKISPNEILSNAIELKDLVKKLKEETKPHVFEIPSLNTRINILYNEVLRLADLTTISAIKVDEINEQLDKTIGAFSALNIKINTLLTRIKFEEEINIDVKFIDLNTTKIRNIIKSVPKNLLRSPPRIIPKNTDINTPLTVPKKTINLQSTNFIPKRIGNNQLQFKNKKVFQKLIKKKVN